MKYLKLKFLLMFFALAMAIPPAWAETTLIASADFTQGDPVTSGNGTWNYSRFNTQSTSAYLGSGGYIRYTDNSLPSTVNMTVETSGYTGSMNVNGGANHSFTANETYTFEDVAVTDGTVTLNNPSGYSPNIAKLTITTASGGDEPTLTTKTSTIVFGDNGSDASQDLGAQADGLSLLKAYTTEGADLIADFEGSKVFKGITGLKFSTGSVDGNLVITLAPSWKATKITVNAKYYNTNTTSKIKITAGNSQTEFYTLTKDYTGYDLSFSEATDITTIRLDAYNRMYVKSITIEYVDDGAPYITVDPEDGVIINDATGDDNRTRTLTATLTNGQDELTATMSSSLWSWADNVASFDAYTYYNNEENKDITYLPLHDKSYVTFSSTNATDVAADLEYNYTGPLYILGYVNGGDWSANNMVQMDGPDPDGIYSVTLPITPNGNNNSEISFSKRKGTEWYSWSEIRDYRFVPVSNGPWGLTESTLGGWHSLDFNPQHVDNQKIVLPAATYTISIDAKNNTFKIERYIVPAETPTFSVPEGTYDENQTVTISCGTAGASIYYTTDGSDPTTSSTLYDGAITVDHSMTIKAIAVKDGYDNSSIASATYIINKTYRLVTDASKLAVGDNIILVGLDDDDAYAMAESRKDNFGPVGVTIDNNTITTGAATVITLEADGDNWNLKTDGGYLYAASSSKNYLRLENEPDENGNAEAAISISNTEASIVFQGTNSRNTIRFNPNNGSPLFSCYASGQQPVYIYKEVTGDEPEPVAAPTFSVEEGTYNQAQNVEISCATSGATIYYTTDGTNPSESSAVYSEPIAVATTTTIKAIAVKDGKSSEIVSAIYTIIYNANNLAAAKALTDDQEFNFTGNVVVTFKQSYNNGNHTLIGLRDVNATEGGGVFHNAKAAIYGELDKGKVLNPGWTADKETHEGWIQFEAIDNVTTAENTAEVLPFDRTGQTLTTANQSEYIILNNVTINGTTATVNTGAKATATYTLYDLFNNDEVTIADGQYKSLVGVVGVNGETVYVYPLEMTPKDNLTLGFDPASVSLYVGETFTAPALTGVPEGETIDVTYTSENPDVATVVDNVVKLVEGATGTATITATFDGDANYNPTTATYTITVKPKENVTLSFGENPDVELYVGETFTAPELTTNPEGLDVTYTVTNNNPEVEVAKINEEGEVELTGKAGTATVTATYAGNNQYNEASASYNITIKAKENVTLSFGENPDVELYVGETFTAPTLTTNPEGLEVTYTVQNGEVEVAKIVNGEVVLTGNAGTATVIATYAGNNQYNSATASYTITVNDVVVALAAPTFAPAAGTYTEPKEVAIACATPGVTIEYTINGVTKTYDGPFMVDHNCTVTATAKMGTRTVYTPATSSATYTINAASAANIADDYYFLQSNADEVSGKYANVAGRRTLNFVADANKQAGTVFRVMTDPDTIGQVETLRSQAVDLQGYANRAMAYVPKVIDLVLSTLANSSLGDPETPGTGILGENGLDLILNKFYEGFDYNLYVEEGTEGTYRIYGRTPSMQHVVDFYHENTAQVEEKLPMLESYINQVLDKIRNKIPAPYDANVVVPFSLKNVRDRIADKYGISLIDPTQDLMGFYRQVLNNKEYVWDFAYQTAMMYVDVIKQTGTYQNLDPEYKLFVEKMEKVRPDTKYYIIERGNELDYISENNTEIINNDPRTLWTLTKRENFTVNVPEDNKLNDSYYTTLYTDFGYELPADADVKAYAVTGIDENDVAQLAELSSPIAAQTPVLLKANAAGTVNVTLTTAAGNTPETNLLEGPDYLITEYQIKTPAVVSLFNMAQGFVPAETLADYEYLQLRYSGTVNNKYFWNVNSDLEDLQGDCVVRSLAVKDGTLAFSEHWKTETNKAFLVSDTKPVIYLSIDTVATPTLSLVAGSYTGEQTLNISCATDDATISYSTDGGKNWTEGTSVTLTDDCTVMVKAEKEGMIPSEVVTAEYIIDEATVLPDVPAMKGYFQIKNNGNEKYAHVQGRKTLTFTDAPADKAGTVIWLETNDKGQVQSLRSQAADLQRYADRVVEYYVPKAVELVVEKLHADGASNILGENGLDAIMDKFNESFDHHLYVEPAEGVEDGYRIFGRTPSMQPVVDFYREHTAQVEAKLPMLESFINSALDKLKQTIGGGGSIFQPFSLLNIWERMGGTLTKPEDDASIMAFYREVLNNKNYVWDFAYQTATFYLENLKKHPRWPEVEAMMGEYAQYFNKLEQVRPDFKYYIVADGEKPDFISEGNVDIINNAARTIWTVEPRTTFTVNITGEQFGCPLATNGVGGYFTTNYTDFAYTLPEGVTAYKVTGVNDEGEATLEALSGTIPAQTPVLLVAKEEGDYALILSTEADTPVENNLLVGPDYLINKYDFKTEQVQSIFDLIKDKLGESFYNNYVAQYEYLADLNSGTVNNKYFWSVDNYLDDLQGDCVVRSLATDENGKLAFSEHWKTETNKAFLVSDTFDVITLPSFERGDVNHDGEINIKDVSDLIDRLLGNEANSCPYCSDVNCDDDVNIKDVSDLIDFLLNSGADTHVDTPTTDPEEGDGN